MRTVFTAVLLASVCIATPVRADLPATIAAIKPAIVILGTYKSTNSPRFALRGTGFVVGDGNLAITNAHVLPQPGKDDADATLVIQVRVGPDQFQMRPATVLGVDLPHDLALLRFAGSAVPALKLGNSDAVREGKAVAFIGFPIGGALGFSPVTHRGMVSSIAPAALPTPTARNLNAKTIRGLRDGESFDIFQLDGTAYPGNSGGPMFDPETGEVLGVLNMVFIKGTRESALTNPSGISYAIPSKFVLELIEQTGAR